MHKRKRGSMADQKIKKQTFSDLSSRYSCFIVASVSFIRETIVSYFLALFNRDRRHL
jgi:hypothetical protein